MNPLMSKLNIGSKKARTAYQAQGGFSLIELIIAICILTVLLGVLIPSFTSLVKSNKEKTCKHNREAILEVYARCVLDSSIDHGSTMPYKTEGLVKVVPKNDAGEVDFAPVKTEVFEYRYCPVGDALYDTSKCCVDESTHTAWIECPYCNNIVSIDLLAFGNRAEPSPSSDVLLTPEPTPSPTEDPDAPTTVTVSFSMNGKTVENADKFTSQEIEKGHTPTRPTEDPFSQVYAFRNWYKDASGTVEFDFGEVVNSDTVVYAGWEPYDADKWWPYADNDSWWNKDTVTTKERYGYHEVEGDGKTVAKIHLKSPSGKFVSRLGNTFVYLGQNDSPRGLPIVRSFASSPEYFAASGNNSQTLAQLTGRVVDVDISSEKRNEYREKLLKLSDPNVNCIYDNFVKIELDGDGVKYTIMNLTPGDEIVFDDGSSKHYYVEWHNAVSDETVIGSGQFANIIGNDNKVGNFYREGP